MKIARRSLSLLLALLMVFALAACAGGGGTSDVGGSSGGGSGSGSGGSSGGFVMPDRPVDETEGKTYIIIQHSDAVNPFGYGQDTQMGGVVSDRLDEVKELYGCEIEFSPIPYSNEFATQLKALEFGEGGGDLVFVDKNAKLRMTLGTGEDSLMTDLLTVDHIINFWDSNKWGTLTARESMMAGGKFFGVTPALWVDCTPLPYYQVVYNKEIVEAAGATDPQESWENNEWDRDAMVDVIKKTTDPAAGVWGMTATTYHMLRATFLSTGKQLVNVDKINADGSVEWTHGLKAPEAQEAITWLKNTLTANGKCFNNGKADWTTWETHLPFNESLCAMAMTRPQDLLNSVAIDGPSTFGVITWAGDEANNLTGYYEQVYSVAIPTFAQSAEHSAFLMADLFEGLEGVEDYEDVLDYYREKYFNSDIDLECMVRDGATIQYFYHPNDSIDVIWDAMGKELLRSSSVSSLIGKYVDTKREAMNTHIIPNKVALDNWAKEGKFD